MILLLMITCIVCIWYGIKIYHNRPLPFNQFSVEVSKFKKLEEVSSLWLNSYLDQYKQKYIWFDKAILDYKITDLEVLNEDSKQVQVTLTLYPKYPFLFNKKDIIQINQGNKEITCLWILRFEESSPNEENKVTYTVTSRAKRVEYDLEEGNLSGRFSYEEEYYKDIAELKKQEAENTYFYKIQNNQIYLTYDDKKTYVEAKLEKPLTLEKEYRLEDGMYQITEDFTLLADANQLYYSIAKDGIFQKVNLPITDEPILYVHFISPEIGYVFTMSGNALGGVIGIRILKTIDGGQTFTEVETTLEAIHQSSKYNIIDENVIFITDMKNGGDSGVLYRSEDGGTHFEIVKLESGTFNQALSKTIPKFSFEEIYDTPQLPIIKDDILYLLVSQGADGDYGNLKALYISNDYGKHFTFVTEIIPNEEG